MSFELHPFKVLRGETFEAAFSNENCAAMTVIYLQREAKSPGDVLLVSRPDGTRVAARQYQMSAHGNKIEGVRS